MHHSATNLINLHGSFARRRGQKVTGVKHRKRRLRLYKVIGAMAFLAMLGGFAFSLWFGANIEKNLKKLASAQLALSQESEQNQELKQQKSKLFSREHVQAAAAVKLNLYPSEERKSRKEGVMVRL